MPRGAPLKRFRLGQAVRIRESDALPRDLFGRTGVVRRLRYSDNGAWVRMHETVPARHRCFADGDDRENDLPLYPEDCEDA